MGVVVRGGLRHVSVAWATSPMFLPRFTPRLFCRVTLQDVQERPAIVSFRVSRVESLVFFFIFDGMSPVRNVAADVNRDHWAGNARGTVLPAYTV